ncbi:MAG: chromosome segregation protein SMC [Verrucomicrobia bacterium]|nr:chromosome segregation protein SMC [Verrucomicrobiota bacterium]
MYLKEVRINGFKSFADFTQLSLEPGVTAIVGPNGCGKSNIADCIRWVLGEQSAKALRGGKMQDVIFEGTDKRKPHSICEVSLIFSDCEKELGEGFHEIEIKRSVVRDGGSAYYINGKACRLKDIGKLFMDTGIGQVSYSFMVQGQIDQILSSNPAERRTIFEEAAGITRYKAQRKEALNKLGHVDTNLARVTDVIEEVARQIGSLRRQASKALRYKRISHRLKHLDLALSSHEFSRIEASLNSASQHSRDFTNKVAELRKSVASREESLETQRESRTQLYSGLEAAQQGIFDLRSKKDLAENQAEFAQSRIEDVTHRLEQIDQDLANLVRRHEEVQNRSQDDGEVRQQQLDLVGNSDEVYESKTKELRDVQGRIAAAEASLINERRQISETEVSISRLRTDVSHLEVALKTDEVKQSSLNEDIHRLTDETSVFEKQLQNIEKRSANFNSEKTEVCDKLTVQEKSSEELLAHFRNLQVEIQDLDRELARMAAHLNVLNDLNKKFEGFSEGAKALLQGRIDAVVDTSEFRLLAKSIKVSSKNTRAVEALLGASLDALLVDSVEIARTVVQQLGTRKLGKACLQFPVEPLKVGDSKDLPDFLIPATSIVKSDEFRTSQSLERVLAGCYVCEDLNVFLDFWKTNPNFVFSRITARSGDLVDRRGWFIGGHSKNEPDSILERGNQIRELKTKIEKHESELEAKRKLGREVDEELSKVNEVKETLKSRLQEIEREESVLQSEKRAAEVSLEKGKERLALMRSNIKEIETTHNQYAGQLTKGREELAASEKVIEDKRNTILEIENSLQALREKLEQKREALSEVRVELAAKKQQLEGLERSLQEMKEQLVEIESLRLQRTEEKESLITQSEELAKQVEEQKALAVKLSGSLDTDQVSAAKLRENLMTQEKEIAERESNLTEVRKELQTFEASLNKEAILLAEKKSQMRYLSEEIMREYDLELAEINWRREYFLANQKLVEKLALDLEEDDAEAPDPDQVPQIQEPASEDLDAMEEPDWEPIKTEVNALRKRLHSMGPVNLVAIEEYAELQERHDFLKTQSDDLWNSKEQLLAAIDDINQTSLAQFKETFSQVRENFIFTFDKLFGGGKADLTLQDAEDPLESGIEIVAQPPGTRLKSITLLSGGQKTMTAVALLFAIYMVKPSPFCLLDELDAPLDDANIGRFVDILHEFTNRSQFLIITHNKRTISSADTIYGVTMQEPGVSKVLSMRFKRESKSTEEVEIAGVGV